MTRAVAVFTVTHGRLRLQVRVLPTVADVNREWQATCLPRMAGHVVNAYFMPGQLRPKAVGTVVFPANGRLAELVPHEVVHAVMHSIGGVHCTGDERLATSVGLLSARIFRQLDRRGIEVRP
jgi:hypothetical protein